MKNIIIVIFLLISSNSFSQKVAILKYKGGGDWYANPTALPNLIKFSNTNASTAINTKVEITTLDDDSINNYPIVFMTGHGNVFFTEDEIENLKNYLTSGGVLHISDNYGLDKYIRRELKKVFPKIDLQEIPNNHPIYHQTSILFLKDSLKFMSMIKNQLKALAFFIKVV